MVLNSIFVLLNFRFTDHPLPTTEECFASVSGGEKFSVIDIKQAYNNVELSTEDQLITTMNTHMGQYVWTRLPYGINSSAAIFQNLMDNVLRGIGTYGLL